MTQDQNLSQGVTPNSEAPAAPTFHRPVPNVRQQMQVQTPASNPAAAAPQAAPQAAPAYTPTYSAQPAPIQPGGQGPLAGLAGLHAAAAQRDQQSEMPMTPAPAYPAAAQDPVQDAVSQPPARPSFPSAPSKVLAEQTASGVDGHLRIDTDAPAFEAPQPEGPRLEGVYPAPQDTAPMASALNPAAAQGERTKPRLQHADPALRAKLAGLAEPNLSDQAAMRPQGPAQATATGEEAGTFWNFEAGTGRVEEESRGSRPWMLIIVALLALIALLAYGAWGQLQNLSFGATPAPVYISAPEGPERIIPEDRGGLVFEGQDLGVLNPEAVMVDGSLAPEISAPIAAQGEGFVATETPIDTLIDAEANAGTTAIDTAAAVNVPDLPEYAPVPRPLDVPQSNPRADEIAAAATTAAAPETTPEATPAPVETPAPATPTAAAPTNDASVVTSPPAGLYVQEGAYGSLDGAKQAYARLRSQNASLTAGLAATYQSVQTGNGQTLYRLYLTGFRDGVDATLIGVQLGRQETTWLIRNG